MKTIKREFSYKIIWPTIDALNQIAAGFNRMYWAVVVHGWIVSSQSEEIQLMWALLDERHTSR